MSWKQEGRERKAKELAKSEEYAARGIGAVKKRQRKKFVVECRYTKDGWLHIQHNMAWMLRWNPNNEWKACGRYARESDASKAVERGKTNWGASKEYRIKSSSQ